MNAGYLKSKHESGLAYRDYLATDPEKATPWNAIYEQVALTDEQRRLVGGFTRRVNVLCVSGIWCGDCVQQGPLLERIAEASPVIDLRWLDRDEHLDLAKQIMINAGLRVPTVIFMAEDYEPVSIARRSVDHPLSGHRREEARRVLPPARRPGAPGRAGGDAAGLAR